MKDWTIRHAFFADMGGFLVKTPDRKAPFPVTAEQLLLLFQKKHLPDTICNQSMIEDKNKRDGLSR